MANLETIITNLNEKELKQATEQIADLKATVSRQNTTIDEQ